MVYIYLAQTIFGVFLWRRFKFSWSDSVLFSLMLLPNILLGSILFIDFTFKLFGAKNKKLKF